MLDNPQGGMSYASEFQSSALPFVTSSQAPLYSDGVLRIDFPTVSRFITLVNHDSAGKHLRIGFTRNGTTKGGNYYTLDGGQSVTFELRVKTLYLAGDSSAPQFALCAGLTTVLARNYPQLSGTLDDGSVGWSGVG